MISAVKVLFLLLSLYPTVGGYTVSVSCTIDTMQIFVGFDEHFHGSLSLRPNTDCVLDGQGRRLLLFSISLQAALTERCSIMQLDHEYVGVLEVQMNKNLILASDSLFLVKCPVHNVHLPIVFDRKYIVNPRTSTLLKRIFRINTPIRADMSLISPSALEVQGLEPMLAVVGQTYSLNLVFYHGNSC